MTEQHHYRETRSYSKSKELGRANIPPSPAPSNGEPANHSLSGVMDDHFEYYPHDQQSNMQSMHPYSQPASRHGTPGPHQQQMYYTGSGYAPQHQQRQQYPQSQYPPPQQYQGHYSPHTSYDEFSSQPYSTPATSPPTPNRGIVTRSGRATAASKLSPPAAVTPKRKKAERTKAVKKSPHLDGPMSMITKDSSIPVVDIEAYVNRSAEVRRQEVATGKIPGKVKRPMNAFMLYRKAYQNRAKEWCSQHNHQVVSQVCGDSWPLEPENVRQQFNDWSKLERDNHQKAHPGYKFTPSKPQSKRTATPAPSNKRGHYDDESVASDVDDPDWPGNVRGKRVKRDHVVRHYEPHPQEMYRPQQVMYNDAYGMPDNRSAFHVSNPGKPLPQPYEQPGMSGHYYATSQQRDWNRQAEDVYMKKTAGPGGGQMLEQNLYRYQQYDSAGYPPSAGPQPHYSNHPLHHGMPQGQGQSPYPGRQPSFSRTLDPSLMPQGGGPVDDAHQQHHPLLELGGQYPHQVDPAHAGHHWQQHGSPPPQQQQQQQQHYYPDQSFESYAGAVGEDVSPLTGLFSNPALDRVLKHDASDWQIIPSSATAALDDASWQDATIEPSALAQGDVVEGGGPSVVA